MKPTTKDAYRLLHEGSIALAEVEANGIRIDVDYLGAAIKDVGGRIVKLQQKLRQDDVYSLWRRTYGEKANLGSREQLADVIFDKLNYKETKERTKTGRKKANESAFEDVDLPFVKRLFQVEKLKKLKGTYLENLQREVVDGFLHPNFNLHTVETFRGSSAAPNFQNLPIRDVAIGKIIRSCFIPRKGNVLVEIDYGALEWRIATCVWKDPKMISYTCDPKSDIHRDKAAECFLCSVDQVERKGMRYVAKNQFVFPKLYGSIYVNMAKNIWESIYKRNLKLKDSETMVVEWLRSKGIDRLGKCDLKVPPVPGTFEHHIKKVEDKFDKEFHVLRDAKRKFIDNYRKRGWFDMPTGFVVNGLHTNNFLLNARIQGSGFHCLLWSMIEIMRELVKQRFKSLIVGEIHDCILADVPINELQDFLYLAKEIMSERIRKAWDWLIVPLEVEVDVVPEGMSWHDKKPWAEVDGKWREKA